MEAFLAASGNDMGNFKLKSILRCKKTIEGRRDPWYGKGEH